MFDNCSFDLLPLQTFISFDKDQKEPIVVFNNAPTVFILNQSYLYLFHLQKNVPFSDFFQVEPLQTYHRVILAEDFMKHLAPTHWPKGTRRGYCWLPPRSDRKCIMKVKRGLWSRTVTELSWNLNNHCWIVLCGCVWFVYYFNFLTFRPPRND